MPKIMKIIRLVIVGAVLAVVALAASALAAVYFLVFRSDPRPKIKPTPVDEPARLAKPATDDVSGTLTVASGSEAGSRVAKIIKLVVVAVVVAIAGLAAVYFLVFSTDSPPEFKPTPVHESTTPAAADLSGTWTVASGSEAGYRVREKLASLPAKSDAVGRTSAVTGTVVIGGTSVMSAYLEVDLTTLTSDKDRRDKRVQDALQTDQLPTATFSLTDPIDIGEGAASTTVFATGDLTIHGVTVPVAIRIKAARNGTHLELVGKTTFLFSVFDIHPPSIAGFVSVEDDATMEFKILLERQA